MVGTLLQETLSSGLNIVNRYKVYKVVVRILWFGI